MGKHYVFHDWGNLKNSWDNRDNFNKYVKKAKWDNILMFLALLGYIYFSLVYVFNIDLPLPPTKAKIEKVVKSDRNEQNTTK
jgi:hypothetical protein